MCWFIYLLRTKSWAGYLWPMFIPKVMYIFLVSLEFIPTAAWSIWQSYEIPSTILETQFKYCGPRHGRKLQEVTKVQHSYPTLPPSEYCAISVSIAVTAWFWKAMPEAVTPWFRYSQHIYAFVRFEDRNVDFNIDRRFHRLCATVKQPYRNIDVNYNHVRLRKYTLKFSLQALSGFL
jgi:hypothetical protein